MVTKEPTARKKVPTTSRPKEQNPRCKRKKETRGKKGKENKI